MKLLIYTNDTATGMWIKETLEEYGKGMHILVRDSSNMNILDNHFSYIITLGENKNDVPDNKPHTNYPVPTNDEEKVALRRGLWILYRDTLRDMIGSKCSCGLYDICHCH